jgi:anti-sigma-K factor RskA
MTIFDLPETDQDLQVAIAHLEARLADLKTRLPAHSIPPALIAELDEIEGLLQAAKARLAEQRDSQA